MRCHLGAEASELELAGLLFGVEVRDATIKSGKGKRRVGGWRRRRGERRCMARQDDRQEGREERRPEPLSYAHQLSKARQRSDRAEGAAKGDHREGDVPGKESRLDSSWSVSSWPSWPAARVRPGWPRSSDT